MWTFLEQMPIVEHGESLNAKTTSFAAVLADERWARNADMIANVQRLAAQLLNDTQQGKTPRASKLLIVTTPQGPQGQTSVYFNLSRADQMRTAKRSFRKPYGRSTAQGSAATVCRLSLGTESCERPAAKAAACRCYSAGND